MEIWYAKCIICGKSLSGFRKLICSRKCWEKHELLGEAAIKFPPTTFTCRQCGKKTTIATKGTPYFCSFECRRANKMTTDASIFYQPPKRYHNRVSARQTMKALYNLKSIGDEQFVITKFDPDLNPETSYLVSRDECACPRSDKPTCRHRQMLPLFLKAKHVDDGFLLDFDTRKWHEPPAEAGLESNEEFERELEPPAPATDEPPAVHVLPPAGAPVDAPSPSVAGAPSLLRRSVRRG